MATSKVRVRARVSLPYISVLYMQLPVLMQQAEVNTRAQQDNAAFLYFSNLQVLLLQDGTLTMRVLTCFWHLVQGMLITEILGWLGQSNQKMFCCCEASVQMGQANPPQDGTKTEWAPLSGRSAFLANILKLQSLKTPLRER